MPQLKVGDKVYFEGEKQGYTVQARNERYVICTKPFNLQKTVLYSIIDLKEHRRGPDNMLFGPGYETRMECEENLQDLIDADNEKEKIFQERGSIYANAYGVSDYRYIELEITKVKYN